MRGFRSRNKNSSRISLDIINESIIFFFYTIYDKVSLGKLKKNPIFYSLTIFMAVDPHQSISITKESGGTSGATSIPRGTTTLV